MDRFKLEYISRNYASMATPFQPRTASIRQGCQYQQDGAHLLAAAQQQLSGCQGEDCCHINQPQVLMALQKQALCAYSLHVTAACGHATQDMLIVDTTPSIIG
jgi:hypothetical protein